MGWNAKLLLSEGWQSNTWSSTPSWNGSQHGHAIVHLGNGYIDTALDSDNAYVALQVL